ncbi:MAG: PEGA domain-containing protein [Desulfobacterales bacterium]|jgi:hypothetical protein
MKIFFHFMMVTGSLFAIFLICLPLSHAELIEPTQRLDGEQKQTGRLTVLSEPPGLEIVLDGNNLGKTPAFLMEVDEGIHTLQVKNSKIEIYIKPGKTLKLSYHKEKFIFIPVAEKEIKKQPGPDEKNEMSKARPKQPKDPIQLRNEKNRQQAIDRFNNFLKGTQDHF